MNIDFLLLVLSFISFVLATIGVPSKVNLVAFGLALYILSLLV